MHLDDPLRYLTQAFVSELNGRAETGAGRVLKGRSASRIFLCFDTFEAVTQQLQSWLLDVFLAEDISPNVVLLIAGQNSLSLDKNLWLKYAADETLYQIEIQPFSKDETRSCLADAAITDSTRVDQIWHLSGGLPLYLGMLTSSRDAKLDPTENVVENFMRWIPEDAGPKRRLVLEASLFSHPFNRDDLKAFSYIADDEREKLYDWLLKQPFIKREGASNRFHEVARGHFVRYLLHRSPDDCRAALYAIANHYQAGLAAIELTELGDSNDTQQWLDLATALISQLFLLPEDDQHVRATNLIVKSISRVKDEARVGKVANTLRGLRHDTNDELSVKGRLIVHDLLFYCDADTCDEAWLAAGETGVPGLKCASG